jgi:hypothetical protein
MDDYSSLLLTVQQQNQRLSALEELLRRNEGSLGASLARTKDVELGMNKFHALLQQVVAENATLSKELASARQRSDAVDRAWRAHAQQSEAAIWSDIRSNKPASLAQDPTLSRIAHEVTQQRAQLNDMEVSLRRVSDAQAADTSAIRICEQHVQAAEGQLAEVVTLQRDGAKDTIRRFEQSFRDLGAHRGDVDRALAAMRQQLERQSRDAATSAEQQAAALATFQQECGNALRGVRDDVANGLAQAASAARANEEASKTLEQILRAEVQTRTAGVDTASRRIAAVEQAITSRLSLVASHQADIARLWETLRSNSTARQRSSRLEGVLSSIAPAPGSATPAPSGTGASPGRHAAGLNGSGVDASGIADTGSRGFGVGLTGLQAAGAVELVRDLEAATGERFDATDAHMLELAETLKRAHGGVEEQVESLASRLGRLEMRLERVASQREDTFTAALQARMNAGSGTGGAAAAADGAPPSASGDVFAREMVESRLRLDRVDVAVEEIKFDMSDLVDSIAHETSELGRRIEALETGKPRPQPAADRKPIAASSAAARRNSGAGVTALELLANFANGTKTVTRSS